MVSPLLAALWSEMNRQQTATEKLKEYARSEGQGAGWSPLNTRSGGSALISEAAKHGAAEKTERVERQSKLTLGQVNAQLLAAIQTSNMALSGKMEEIKTDISFLRQDMQCMREQITEAENRVLALEDSVLPMVHKLQITEKRVAMWQQKLDNFEMRQNNIRIIGLPERSECRRFCGNMVEGYIS